MKPLALLEDVIKKPVFGCRTCGQCVLHSTGMTCPMTCPKTLRNGPCGGVRENGHCEVKPEMRCVWVTAVDRAEHLPLLPAKWRHEIDDLRPPGRQPAARHLVVAQPGDRPRPPHAGGLEAGGVSALREKLERGEFVVTAEMPVIDGGGLAEIAHQLGVHGALPGRGERDRQRRRPRPRVAAGGVAGDPRLRLGADHAAGLPRPEPAGARGRHRWARRCTASRTSAA